MNPMQLFFIGKRVTGGITPNFLFLWTFFTNIQYLKIIKLALTIMFKMYSNISYSLYLK